MNVYIVLQKCAVSITLIMFNFWSHDKLISLGIKWVRALNWIAAAATSSMVDFFLLQSYWLELYQKEAKLLWTLKCAFCLGMIFNYSCLQIDLRLDYRQWWWQLRPVAAWCNRLRAVFNYQSDNCYLA